MLRCRLLLDQQPESVLLFGPDYLDAALIGSAYSAMDLQPAPIYQLEDMPGGFPTALQWLQAGFLITWRPPTLAAFLKASANLPQWAGLDSAIEGMVWNGEDFAVLYDERKAIMAIRDSGLASREDAAAAEYFQDAVAKAKLGDSTPYFLRRLLISGGTQSPE